jgi:hypothetical protein
MQWCDRLRVKSEFPINLWPNAVQAYHHWIRDQIAADVPYDRFARALLTSSGSNFRVPAANFYRAVASREPDAVAQAVALTFMGTRAERWPSERRVGMAGFFAAIGYKPTAEWKEEIVFFDREKTWGHALVFPDGTAAHLRPGEDPRAAFADWLVTPSNPWFTRAMVNRVWASLLGHGLLEDVDDVEAGDGGDHRELLAALQDELITSGYDLKHLYRAVLTSDAYQSVPPSPAEGAGGTAAFARYAVRRLEAEVLIDALDAISGLPDAYTSAIPEPYTFLPAGQRAISLADGSLTSPFLETFGRPPRDTGLADERNERVSAAQRLYLLNSSHVQIKLEQGPRLQALFRGRDPRRVVPELYLTILTRLPTDEEERTARAYFDRAPGPREAAVDLAWALVNSAEFLYRH